MTAVRYERVRLAAIGFELAPVVVTTAELEERLAPLLAALALPRGQIAELTGIRERRWWEPGTRLADAAAAAGRRALAHAELPPERIGALVYAAVCREGYEPATATAVAARLGIGTGATIYDLSNACLGVMNGILDVANRIELGQIEAGLVVAAESAREIVEQTIAQLNAEPTMARFLPALATLTGGSGAAAVLLVRDDALPGAARLPRLRGGVATTAPEHHELCRWGVHPDPEGRPGVRIERMSTDSAAVMRHGVALGTETWRRFLAGMGWSKEDVARTICHQVGAAHRDGILKMIGVPPERDFITYPYLGNIGTVSLPITAAIAVERGALRAGENVAFLGIGSGLVCLMLGWEW